MVAKTSALSSSVSFVPPDQPVFEFLGEEFVNEIAVAKMLGKSLRTIKGYRFKRTGPPFIQIGQKILYRKSAVKDWLLKHEIVPQKPQHTARRRKTSAAAAQ